MVFTIEHVVGAAIASPILLLLLGWFLRRLGALSPTDAEFVVTQAIGITRGIQKLEERVASGEPLDARQIRPLIQDTIAEVASERGHQETFAERVAELLAAVKSLVLPATKSAGLVLAVVVLSACSAPSAARTQIANMRAITAANLREWPTLTDEQRARAHLRAAQAFDDLDASINGHTAATLTLTGGR